MNTTAGPELLSVMLSNCKKCKLPKVCEWNGKITKAGAAVMVDDNGRRWSGLSCPQCVSTKKPKHLHKYRKAKIKNCYYCNVDFTGQASKYCSRICFSKGKIKPKKYKPCRSCKTPLTPEVRGSYAYCKTCKENKKLRKCVRCNTFRICNNKKYCCKPEKQNKTKKCEGCDTQIRFYSYCTIKCRRKHYRSTPEYKIKKKSFS